MAAIDDLKSAIADLGTSIAASNAEIEKLLSKIAVPGATDAEIGDAVTQIRAVIQTNADEVAKAKAAVP